MYRADVVKKDRVQIHQVRVSLSWMDLIVSFLKDDALPGEIRSREDTKKSSSVLAVRGSQAVQALLFWAVSAMSTP